MNFGIAAGHEVTADIAAEILRSGGNAYDAAVAALFGTYITETMMSSAGAGGFANIYTAQKESTVLDFFCHTPAIKNQNSALEFTPVIVDFGDEKETFYVGAGSMAVPGSIACCFELNSRFGTMSIHELAQPAIQLAKNGIEINTFQFIDLDLLKSIFMRSADGRRIFCQNEVDIKQEGDKMYMPHMADFLDALTLEGADLFYKGEIAASIVNHTQTNGFLQMSDFENYKVKYHSAHSIPLENNIVLCPPEPSFGGRISALYFEELLRNKEEKNIGSTQHLQWLYEASKKARRRYESEKNESNLQKGGTTHFSIIDKWGNAISLTTSIGEGSGWFIPGTDMQMNNMLGELSLLPQGLHSWIPNTRLNSMMTPTLVLDQDRNVVISLGSGGASRIPYMITQVLVNSILLNQSIEQAIKTPRVHYEHQTLQVEKGFDLDGLTIRSGDKLNAWTSSSLFFGGVHSVVKDGDQFRAFGDSRRYGKGLAE